MSSAIVILNWNGRADTLRCLESLVACGDELTAILVDNGSTDGTVDEVRREFPAVVIIENETNLGYAAGNNRGLRWALDAGHEYVGVLNNDTTVAANFLGPLVATIAADAGRRFVTPLIRYLDEPDRIWFGGAVVDRATEIFLHRQMTVPDAEPVTPTPMVSGCALFAHRSLWKKVGLFAEGYFLIFEDAEWSARANTLGCVGLVVNQSCVLHAVSSTINTHAASAAHYYYARNGVFFIRAHGARPVRSVARFVERLARDSTRGLRAAPALPSFAAPALHALGLVDAARGRAGAMPDSFVSRAVVSGLRARAEVDC